MKELLERLGKASGAPPFSELYALSDLAGDKLVEFRAAWDEWSNSQQRHQLIRSLADLTEASIHVNFDSVFRHAMDDPDDLVRSTAINGLWENEDLTLIGPLLRKLRSDPSPRVRAAAAEGLGRFVLKGELEELDAVIHARLVTELLTTFHLAEESIGVRRRAVESVAYACTPEITEVLEAAYADPDEQMRLSAVVGMGRTCRTRWSDIVLEELQSPSPAMRYEAVVACGGLALRDATPHLTALLQDADRQVRNAAIWSLGQIGGDRAKQALISALEEADDDTSAALDDALAELTLGEGELDLLLYDIDEDLTESMQQDDLDDDWGLLRSDTDGEDWTDPEDWDF